MPTISPAIYAKALAGLTRCNAPAAHIAANGYAMCPAHREPMPYVLPIAHGYPTTCDHPLDGFGAMSWPRRLAIAAR